MTKFWPSRKEPLLDNAELLLDSGINITVERNLDILAGESFRNNHYALHYHFVLLITANLSKMEHRIAEQSLKDLQLSVFEFITCPASYTGALDPPDRTIIDDDGEMEYVAQERSF